MNYYVFSITYMAIFGYFGHFAKISKNTNIILILLTGIVVNIPIDNISINMLTYSFFGEMSILTFALSLMLLFESFKIQKIQNNFMDIKAFIFIFIFGLILYLSVLNIIPLNLYYQSPQIVIIICCLLTFLAYVINKSLGMIYFICLLSYGLKLMESNNLFDYLIDVPVWIFSILYIFVIIVKKIVSKK
ncbi:hypothetical protein [Helicobacter sp. 13S00477-4]|uniref:hypothetical protein n=1 Tax=Helicobacter sp. 13S00477-4 TaxID=1905759 RepID=UPI000BA5FEC2|nr:hypothetical protein [Helicobacter sp. 13S00477-4]PAF52862.1 hypothetical protein BKH44_01385 [Helicobacter sp. 13S00477-4]